MDELISKRAAIDAINRICPVDTEYDCTLLDRVDVRCVLSDLPSAQPDLSAYSDRLWKAAYERGKAEAGIPWKKLERYAEFFCADVPYTEFVREAKQFCLDAERSEE